VGYPSRDLLVAVRHLLRHHSMTTNPDKLAAFFALLDKRSKEHEARLAQERKDREDKKLARIRPWWLTSAG